MNEMRGRRGDRLGRIGEMGDKRKEMRGG